MSPALIVFAALNLFDGWSTWQVIRFGGYEANKIVAGIIAIFENELGMGAKKALYFALLAVKVGAVAVVWWASLHGLGWRILSVIDALYFVVMVSNYYQLQKHKKN